MGTRHLPHPTYHVIQERPNGRFIALLHQLSRLTLTLILGLALIHCGAGRGNAESTSESTAATHPRAETVRHVFNDLVGALAEDYPAVQAATLHFVDVAVPNAWVNQNAEVYVSTGLLDLLQTDDQFAGVLAHELAHVTQQHVPQQIRRHLQWSLLVLGLALTADRSGPDDNKVLQALQPLVLYGYSREAELEADEVGVQHTTRAGYDPQGLLEALELITLDSVRNPADELWMTHPLPELRLGVLRRRLDPRMGIPTARPEHWGGRTRTQYENPVDAATAFIQAVYTDPLNLTTRLGDQSSLPAELQDGSRSGIFPEHWPANFTVRPLGVVIEEEEQALLHYSVTGHLELASPLGTMRGPTLTVTVQPTANGWQVAGAQLPTAPTAPLPDGSIGRLANLADPVWTEYVHTMVAALEAGEPTELPPSTVEDVSLSDPTSVLEETIHAVQHMRRAGFIPAVVGIDAVPLSADQLAARGASALNDRIYLDVQLWWRVTAPTGEVLWSQQRLWVAATEQQSGLATAAVRVAPPAPTPSPY